LSEQAQDAPHLYILADDLIWATRLAGQGRTLGAQVTTLKGVAELRDLLLRGAVGTRDLIAIDTTTRVEEPIALVREAAANGRVLALVQHDDPALRAAALEAGALRAMPYRALFERGHAILAALLDLPLPAVGSLEAPSPSGGVAS
jgi:DNA-binding NarL/FixJ family response regulator